MAWIASGKVRVGPSVNGLAWLSAFPSVLAMWQARRKQKHTPSDTSENDVARDRTLFLFWFHSFPKIPPFGFGHVRQMTDRWQARRHMPGHTLNSITGQMTDKGSAHSFLWFDIVTMQQRIALALDWTGRVAQQAMQSNLLHLWQAAPFDCRRHWHCHHPPQKCAALVMQATVLWRKEHSNAFKKHIANAWSSALSRRMSWLISYHVCPKHWQNLPLSSLWSHVGDCGQRGHPGTMPSVHFYFFWAVLVSMKSGHVFWDFQWTRIQQCKKSPMIVSPSPKKANKGQSATTMSVKSISGAKWHPWWWLSKSTKKHNTTGCNHDAVWSCERRSHLADSSWLLADRWFRFWKSNISTWKGVGRLSSALCHKQFAVDSVCVGSDFGSKHTQHLKEALLKTQSSQKSNLVPQDQWTFLTSEEEKEPLKAFSNDLVLDATNCPRETCWRIDVENRETFHLHGETDNMIDALNFAGNISLVAHNSATWLGVFLSLLVTCALLNAKLWLRSTQCLCTCEDLNAYDFFDGPTLAVRDICWVQQPDARQKELWFQMTGWCFCHCKRQFWWMFLQQRRWSHFGAANNIGVLFSAVQTKALRLPSSEDQKNLVILSDNEHWSEQIACICVAHTDMFCWHVQQERRQQRKWWVSVCVSEGLQQSDAGGQVQLGRTGLQASDSKFVPQFWDACMIFFLPHCPHDPVVKKKSVSVPHDSHQCVKLKAVPLKSEPNCTNIGIAFQHTCKLHNCMRCIHVRKFWTFLFFWSVCGTQMR